jgi:hypothetical protein
MGGFAMSEVSLQEWVKPGRWARRLVGMPQGGDQRVNAEVENLYLREEIDRIRLSQAGAHPATSMVDALRTAEVAADVGDSVTSMYAQALAVHQEVLNLVQLLRRSLGAFEDRMAQVTTAAAAPGPDRPDTWPPEPPRRPVSRHDKEELIQLDDVRPSRLDGVR